MSDKWKLFSSVAETLSPDQHKNELNLKTSNINRQKYQTYSKQDQKNWIEIAFRNLILPVEFEIMRDSRNISVISPRSYCTSVYHLHPTHDKSVLSKSYYCGRSRWFWGRGDSKETVAAKMVLCHLGPSSSWSYCRMKMHSRVFHYNI